MSANLVNTVVMNVALAGPWLSVSRQPLTTEARILARVTSCGIVDRVSLGRNFLRILLFLPVSIIPPWLSILIRHMCDEK